jgi:hypothetical protein
MTLIEMPNRTLPECLQEGKLPQSDALGYAVALAQEICRIHAAGRVHGALSPAAIVLTEGRLELLPADNHGEVTPYTAPEVLAGAPADALSDIFSFGAVAYELLSGRRAFEGDTPEAVAQAIAGSQPASCGVAAIDSLIQTCLAKDRAARFQRVEKILMELKLAAIAGRLCQLPAIARWEMAAARLESELRDVQRTLALQAAAIESFRVEMRRNEGLLGWVVDILEVLQTNALDQPRGAVGAGAPPSWADSAVTRRDFQTAEVHRVRRPADELVNA